MFTFDAVWDILERGIQQDVFFYVVTIQTNSHSHIFTPVLLCNETDVRMIRCKFQCN